MIAIKYDGDLYDTVLVALAISVLAMPYTGFRRSEVD